jgi:hypothetical protein
MIDEITKITVINGTSIKCSGDEGSKERLKLF